MTKILTVPSLVDFQDVSTVPSLWNQSLPFRSVYGAGDADS